MRIRVHANFYGTLHSTRNVKKPPLKKRVTRSTRPRSNVDPTRAALAALDRIRHVLVQSGYDDRLGEPLTMSELAAQAQFLGMELPPSYVAAMRVASKIGEPDVFLDSAEMAREAATIIAAGGDEASRYAPFCIAHGRAVCFDKAGGASRILNVPRQDGELPVVEWHAGQAFPVAAHFGEWLDAVADAREEAVETAAARIPPPLKRLLYELGFRFEYPLIGTVETGDVNAVEALIGPALARDARGDVDRLFDATGKATLTLNVDEYTLVVTLRTGAFLYEAEEVFRWFRQFRNENFFGDGSSVETTSSDTVRDLRRAPREAPLVQRGVLEVPSLEAKAHTFHAASGASGSDFYLLARPKDGTDGSVILHVVEGVIATHRKVSAPLVDLLVDRDGAMWGLTESHAINLTGGSTRTFALGRTGRGSPRWFGIGAASGRVVVWGAGTLLEFDGNAFVPFEPDAMLDESESVVALVTHGPRISMAVCGDRMGAVARYDGMGWQAIGEDQVVDAALVDLDVWRGAAYVLDRTGGLWKAERGAPRPVGLRTRSAAFLTDAGVPRQLFAVRAFDGGLLLASEGGVVATGNAEPVFHAIAGGAQPVRLARLGAMNAGGGPAADPNGTSDILALGGSHVWLFREGAFEAVDMSEW